MDSTTARAHHHAAGMVCDGELIKALEKAFEQEKGLSQGVKPQNGEPGEDTDDGAEYG